MTSLFWVTYTYSSLLFSAEWYKKHDSLPTLEDIKNVYNLPEDEEDATYNYKKDLLIWYMDVYLPYAVGVENYGPTVRYWKLPISSMEVDGVRKPLCPRQGEAMGMLLYHNCLPKWTHICPEKAKDWEWKAPDYVKDDPETHKYHITEWSDGKSGQVTGGGWKPDAYVQFNVYNQHIRKIRKDDKANGWAKLRQGLKLMRNEHGITTKKYSKKRGRSTKPTREAPVYVDIEEMSDEYSVHSDVSTGDL